MELCLAIHSNADKDLEAAAVQNDPEIVRRISFGVERGTMALEAWLLRSQGRPTQSGGTEFRGRIPAEHLEDLLGELRGYQDLTDASVACGVGSDEREAELALRVARKRGGDPSVVLYTPEAVKELEDEPEDELASLDRLSLEPTAKAEGEAKPGEATKVAQGTIRPSAAEPSAPSAISPPSAPSPVEGGGAATPAPANNQQLLQAVGQVLADVKRQLPTLEQLKEANPDAYGAIVEMSQAIIALAQKLTGGGQPVQKAEPHALHPHAPLNPNVRHHHLNLAVGSNYDGKVKVVHADGTVSWVQARAGQVMSKDGHPVSSRNPGGK